MLSDLGTLITRWPKVTLIIGVLLLIYTLYRFVREHRTGDWYAVRGRVISSYLKETLDSDGDQMWEPRVHYEYEFRGKRYEGTHRPSNGWETTSQRVAGWWLASYDAGERVDVFVNPRDPKASTLVSGIRLFVFLLNAAIALPLIVMSVRKL